MSLVDFSLLGTRIRDFSLVSPSRVPGDKGGGSEHAMHAAALATSDGKILVRSAYECEDSNIIV